MIKLVRVDHRLLHGLVIFSWTKQVGTNYIIVADDKVPNDPISMMALSIAKPVDCELSIIPFSQLRKLVDENASKNIMIIVKGPAEALQLAKELPEVTEINSRIVWPSAIAAAIIILMVAPTETTSR